MYRVNVTAYRGECLAHAPGAGPAKLIAQPALEKTKEGGQRKK